MQLKQETAEDDRKKFHMVGCPPDPAAANDLRQQHKLTLCPPFLQVSRLRKAKVHANELNQLVKDCPRSDARLELEAAVRPLCPGPPGSARRQRRCPSILH